MTTTVDFQTRISEIRDRNKQHLLAALVPPPAGSAGRAQGESTDLEAFLADYAGRLENLRDLPPSELPDNAKEILATYQNENGEATDQTSTKTVDDTDLRKKNIETGGKDGIDDAEFKRRVQERKEKNIRQAIERENKVADQLIQAAVGQSPIVQNGILAAYDLASDFINMAWAKVAEFFLDLISKFKEFANRVIGWFADLGKTIGNFWSSFWG